MCRGRTVWFGNAVPTSFSVEWNSVVSANDAEGNVCTYEEQERFG